MFRVAIQEANRKFWHFDIGGNLMGAIIAAGVTLAYYQGFDLKEAFLYIFPFIAFIFVRILWLICAYIVTLARRYFFVGFLDFEIAYEDGIVTSHGDEYICVNVNSLEARDHHLNLHFRCHARFAKINRKGRRPPIVSNYVQYLSWAGKREPGKEFEYGEIPDGNNVIHFARLDKENNELIFFTSAGALRAVEPGIYNVDIILGGMCKEIDKCIRPRRFKGQIHFIDTNNVRLIRRRWWRG